MKNRKSFFVIFLYPLFLWLRFGNFVLDEYEKYYQEIKNEKK